MSGFAIHTVRSLRTVAFAPISSLRLQTTGSHLRVPVHARLLSSNPLNRPGPPPLPRAEQREFEELVRKAQAPLSHTSIGRDQAEAELAMHPDARKPLPSEFEGDINPETGEQGGPKREPVRHWAEGDWSFKGRVSDF